MSLQTECSVEESVTIRAVKRLEDCINVVHVAYMVVVFWQSLTIFVFLHTSSFKFSDNVPIHNIYIIQECSELADLQQKGYGSYGLPGIDRRSTHPFY